MKTKKPKFKRGTPEHREFMRSIGVRGGQNTKKRLAEDPDYYSRNGRAGGEAMKVKYGREHFVKMAAMREYKKGLHDD